MRRSRLVRRCGSRRRSTVWCCPRATIPEPPVSPRTTWGTAPCRTIVKPSRVRGHVQSPDRGHGTGRPHRRATAPSRGCARLPRCYRSPDSSPDSMKRSLHLASLLVALPAALIAQQGAPNGAELFITKGCLGCHGASGRGGVGPMLAVTRLSLDAFVHQLRQPRQLMPRFPVELVSDAEAAAIRGYLQSVPAPPTCLTARSTRTVALPAMRSSSRPSCGSSWRARWDGRACRTRG